MTSLSQRIVQKFSEQHFNRTHMRETAFANDWIQWKIPAKLNNLKYSKWLLNPAHENIEFSQY